MLYYEDFPTDYHANVNTSMTAHTYDAITTKPVVATTHEETTLGPIGMALNENLFIMIEKAGM
jgi:hypothetical protein